MFSARYSSGSSGSAPFSFASCARFSSKASEMYLRKMRPRTPCLYSAASMLLRSLSAASQSLASKPRLAVELFFDVGERGIEREFHSRFVNRRKAKNQSFAASVLGTFFSSDRREQATNRIPGAY